MTLSLVYRLNGLIGLIWAASMWFTPEMMAAQFQFESTPDMVTMGQYLGTTMLFVSVMFLMLPNWTSAEQLKKATMPLILLQVIYLLVQLFHIYTEAIPSGGMQYFGVGLTIVFILLFYWKSR